MSLYRRRPTCLLHNSHVCAKNNTITKTREDQVIRIVIAYDWSMQSTGIRLIRAKIDEIVKTAEETLSVIIKVQYLGGKDADIFCNICR